LKNKTIKNSSSLEKKAKNSLEKAKKLKQASKTDLIMRRMRE